MKTAKIDNISRRQNRLVTAAVTNLSLVMFGLWTGMSQVAAATPGADESTLDSTSTPEQWAVHGQITNVTQGHRRFTSPYSGDNSLKADGRTEETTDLTLYIGARLWRGAELWLNPEIDQGFGLSNTVGMAGFPSGEAYKIGANAPYLRLPRAFIRYAIPLGGSSEKIEPVANQLASSKSSDNLTMTIGKFSVVDIFDTNTYAHDPRVDFLNWSVVDAGAFDYAADAWDFTYGAAAEWTQNAWSIRGGIFQLSKIPNGKVTGIDFSQYMAVGELEERHQWRDHPGRIKFLTFINRGRMASYRDAVQLGRVTGDAPDVSLIHRVSSRPGMAVNLEQELSLALGAFARVSVNDGSKEAYEFTEINKSLSAGLSLKGDHWGRHDDRVAVAVVVNGLSKSARDYFTTGGTGILIGDGKLKYSTEKILETYYSMYGNPHLTVALNYQYVSNPAYNHDRGPVSIFGARLHAEF